MLPAIRNHFCDCFTSICSGISASLSAVWSPLTIEKNETIAVPHILDCGVSFCVGVHDCGNSNYNQYDCGDSNNNLHDCGDSNYNL